MTTAFDLLRDDRRRRALAVLSRRDSPVSLTELADAVASEAATADSADGTDRIAVSLHHVHLPKLAEADVVSYDPETKTVTPERIEALAPYASDELAEA